MVISVLGGRHAAEGVVGTVLIVVDQEAPRRLADVLQPGEQVLVKHLLAVGPVEALDVVVLVWLAGLDVLNGHPGQLGSLGEGLAQELRAVVGAKHLR